MSAPHADLVAAILASTPPRGWLVEQDYMTGTLYLTPMGLGPEPGIWATPGWDGHAGIPVQYEADDRCIRNLELSVRWRGSLAEQVAQYWRAMAPVLNLDAEREVTALLAEYPLDWVGPEVRGALVLAAHLGIDPEQALLTWHGEAS